MYKDYNCVIIKGPALPPIGGVSVYLDRFNGYLKEENQDVFFWETNKNSWNYYSKMITCLLKRWEKKTVLHLHSVSNKHILIALLISYIKNIDMFFTHHNIWAINKKYRVKMFLLKIMNKRIDKIFYNNVELPKKYKEVGIEMLHNSEHINPFIPPLLERKQSIIASYPPDLILFIERNDNNLIVCAHKIIFHDNIDLYGIDMSIKALNHLSKHFPRMGLIIAIANLNEREYLNDLIKALEKNMKDQIYILSPQYEVWPLFEYCSLYLRPTSSDGYGLSIDEAIYMGSKALASDVCRRHPEAYIFSSRNQIEFENSIVKILESEI